MGRGKASALLLAYAAAMAATTVLGGLLAAVPAQADGARILTD